jgi:hypothetical protein
MGTGTVGPERETSGRVKRRGACRPQTDDLRAA